MSAQTRFLKRLQQDSEAGASLSVLSPLQTRLCDGLMSLTQVGLPAQASLMVGGMVKHLRRNPMPDSEIRSSLEWLQGMLSTILTDPVPDDVG